MESSQSEASNLSPLKNTLTSAIQNRPDSETKPAQLALENSPALLEFLQNIPSTDRPSNTDYFKNLISTENRNLYFDLKLHKLKLPGQTLPRKRGHCPPPCFPGAKIEPSKAAAILQFFAEILLANEATLRELELTSTRFFYRSLESLPKMENVTFFRMNATGPWSGSSSSFYRWLGTANFPELRHLSLTIRDSCLNCRRMLPGGSGTQLFDWLEPLEQVKRVDISARYGDYPCRPNKTVLDGLPRVFPALSTLLLNNLETFPEVSAVLWKMESLENLELEIVHKFSMTHELDLAFTGLSSESLEKVVKIMLKKAGQNSKVDPAKSCLSESLLKNAKMTRGPSILDLKALKKLDLKFVTIDDQRKKKIESITAFAPLTAILAVGPLQKFNGTRIRERTQDGWKSLLP